MIEKKKLTPLLLAGIFVLMLGLSYAAVPLYDLFCRVTGFGGTTQVSTYAQKIVLDKVVSVRFDTIVSDKIEWKNFLHESYDWLSPIGFNTINYKKKWPHHEFAPMHEGAQFYINDALIFHPRRLWNTELVDSLHSERNLMGAEEGWYQVLSEPWGNIHKSWHGGAYMAGVWEHIKDVDESLHN